MARTSAALPRGIVCRAARADERGALALLEAYYAELTAALGSFDPARSVSADVDEMVPDAGAFLMLEAGGRPLGCVGLKTHAPGVGEVKRMFVVADARGRGLGRALLSLIEAEARRLGMRRLVLDTAAPLVPAATLYLAAGYREVPAFNDNPYAARWFAKDLD